MIDDQSMTSGFNRVGIGDMCKCEVWLIIVRDALLFGLSECLLCLDISSFGQEYRYKANTNGEFILTIKQVFDPGGK